MDKMTRLLALVEARKTTNNIFDMAKKAGYKGTNERTIRRHIADAEKFLGIRIEPFNSKNSTSHMTSCPSTLDTDKAKKYKNYIVTSCTNDTKINRKFLATLQEFARIKKAQILIVPLNYKNTSLVNREAGYHWDSTIYQYALLEDIQIHTNLVIKASRINATAVNPLSGMESLGGTKSTIFGHPQLSMQLVSAPRNMTPKMMRTTGSISYKSYTSSKAGEKGYLHHSFSAIFVQTQNKYFYTNELSWDGSGFQYLNKYYSENICTDAKVIALIMGDEHVKHNVPEIQKARKRLVNKLKPSKLIRHDTFDGYSQSHHHNRITKIRIALEGNFLVEKEVKECVEHINSTGAGFCNIMIQSNHNEHLDKWLNRFNPDQDPHNAFYYNKLMSKVLETGKPALECAFMLYPPKVEVIWSHVNQPYKIKGIDVSQHGDRGANGSRGSAVSIAKAQYKTIIGHSHSPRIEKGCWQVGTSTLDLDYAQGLSTWMVSDILIYENGKRNMMFYLNNKTIVDL